MANVFKMFQNCNIQQPEIITISRYEARKHLQTVSLFTKMGSLQSLTVKMYDVDNVYTF